MVLQKKIVYKIYRSVLKTEKSVYLQLIMNRLCAVLTTRSSLQLLEGQEGDGHSEWLGEFGTRTIIPSSLAFFFLNHQRADGIMRSRDWITPASGFGPLWPIGANRKSSLPGQAKVLTRRKYTKQLCVPS